MKRIRNLFLIILSAISLTSCTLPGIGGDVDRDVVVAAGAYSERKILGEIVIQMIKHYTDLRVEKINNLNSTTMINMAMLNGDLNAVGSMYTGTSLTGELGMEPIKDPEECMKVVQREYLRKFNRIWYDSWGFENTYAFMAKPEFLKKHNITKVSDLEKVKDSVRVGVDTGWINRPGDGYGGFKEIYGFKFQKIYPMDIGLVYTALANNSMDVVLGYSTDGRIASYGLELIKDDKRLFPPYDCSPMASKEIIDKYPELDKIFKKLVGTISSEDMQELNRQCDEDLLEPVNVAKQFLEKHNYFEDKEVD